MQAALGWSTQSQEDLSNLSAFRRLSLNSPRPDLRSLVTDSLNRVELEGGLSVRRLTPGLGAPSFSLYVGVGTFDKYVRCRARTI